MQRLRVRPLKVHLTLMSTGEGGSRGGRGGGAAVVRQYAGAMLERMIRQVRIDDVVVNVPPFERNRFLITQSAFSVLISETLLKSLKKSFYTAKFMLKGLDAWSDRLLGLQTDGQLADERQLKRLRPIDDEWVSVSSSASGLSSTSDTALGSTSSGQLAAMSGRRVFGLGGKAISWGAGTLAQAPGIFKQAVKKSVSVAGKGVSAAGGALRQGESSVTGRPFKGSGAK